MGKHVYNNSLTWFVNTSARVKSPTARLAQLDKRRAAEQDL